jgi:hypothetical protein
MYSRRPYFNVCNEQLAKTGRMNVERRSAKNMKTPSSIIKKAEEVKAEEPFVSFAHLTSYFSPHENSDENQTPAYGFPQSREEILYETGTFIKLFMKC